MDEKKEIRCRAILEVLGKPKEHVDEALKKYVGSLEKDSSFKVLKTELAEAKETDLVEGEEPYYTAFAEVEFLFKNIMQLGAFCFNYMPSSIEIIEPDTITLKNFNLSNMLNDLQARSHEVNRAVKEMQSENEFLKRNLNTLLKNSVLISLKINNLSSETISRVTGIKEEELKIFLEELIKEKKIEKVGDMYCLKSA